MVSHRSFPVRSYETPLLSALMSAASKFLEHTARRRRLSSPTDPIPLGDLRALCKAYLHLDAPAKGVSAPFLPGITGATGSSSARGPSWARRSISSPRLSTAQKRDLLPQPAARFSRQTQALISPDRSR